MTVSPHLCRIRTVRGVSINGFKEIETLSMGVINIIKHESWKHVTDWDGRPYGSFAELIERPAPDGMHTTVERLKGYLTNFPAAIAAIESLDPAPEDDESRAYVERERETARALLAELKADKDAPPGTKPWAYHRLDQSRELVGRITQDLRQLRSLLIELYSSKAEKVLGWRELGFNQLISQKTGVFSDALSTLLQSDSLVTLDSLIDLAQKSQEPKQQDFGFGSEQKGSGA